jgi:hypothetical protein
MPRSSYSAGLFDAEQGLLPASQSSQIAVAPAGVLAPVGEFVGGSKRKRFRRKKSSQQSLEDDSQAYSEELQRNPALSVVAGTAREWNGPSGANETAPQAPLDNMALQTLHRRLLQAIPGLRVVCGVDKMEILFYGDSIDEPGLSEECPDGARAVYDRCQVARVVNAESPFSEAVVMMGATIYPVNGHAVSRGGRMMYPYQFEWLGMRFAVGNPLWQPTNLGKTTYGGKLEYRLLGKVILDSTALTTWGAELLVARAKDMFARLGLRISESRVSLVHLRFDLVGCPAHPLVWLLDAEWCRTNWKWGDREAKGPAAARESMLCGKSNDIRLNLYDKLQEFRARCENGGSAELDLKWEAAVADWGCVPDDVTRCEFQFSGTWMRRRFDDCKRVEDVLSRLQSMAAVLLSEQLVLLAQEPDRANNHQGRCATHPLWVAVQNAAAQSSWNQSGRSDAELVKIKRGVSTRCIRRLMADTARIGERWAALVPAEVRDNWRDMETVAKLGAAAFIMAADGDSGRMLAGARLRLAKSKAAGLSPFLEAVELPVDRCRGMYIDVGFEAPTEGLVPSFFSLLVDRPYAVADDVPF